ncbi:hypothetical protein RDMS_13625 [Deinococcus sp. RL]|uniref:hypothetical protein n=1 Tax=Deinococcus sp. RL TaxID=1489678 RepID=UPI0004D77404|nr:hypothetical protein [Deinococcus sp. RL]KEF33229.1 hypothetical protein RDMS_13625 [Deinococcus sp. RL]
MAPPLPPALADLFAYGEPLAAGWEEVAGGVALFAPGTNVLALNAALLPDAAPARLREAAAWQRARGQPPLLAVVGEEGRRAEAVASVRVGFYCAGEAPASAQPSPFAVEQVSRLHLPQWAAVLAEAYSTLEWAGALARHLAGRLEGRRDYVLLLAYAKGEAAGALLWQAADTGGRAHLWGTLNPAATRPLLDGAAALAPSFPLRVSVPSAISLSLPLTEAAEVSFILMKNRGNPPS